MTATSAGQLTRPIADAAGPSARRLLTVLLRRYGIPVAETVTADSADCAVEAAWWLGFPVTMVAEGARLAGRPETTRCGLATPAQVRVAYRRLAASLGPSMTGVRIRRQPQQGAEVIVRFTRDAEGQARVWLVLGGPAGALVGARVCRLAPLTARDARGMLEELHGGRARQPDQPSEPQTAAGEAAATRPGQVTAAAAPPAGPEQSVPAAEPAALDVGALAGLLERVSRLAVTVPQVIELELNPVIVTRCGAAVAGVRGQFRRSGDAGRGASRTQARLRRVS
jgi:ATP-grasp domain